MKEIKVDVKPVLKRLELISKKRLVGLLTGEFKSVFRGRGLEFHGYRKYHAGEDDAKNIDWKASLRSRYLVVKELVEERNNNVLFVIDVSSSMSFGSVPKLKNEYCIELFAAIAHALLAEGDSVGLAMVADGVRKFVRPNIGNKQLYIMLKALQEPANYEGDILLGDSMHQLNAMMGRPSIVILLSDFLDLKDNWQEELKLFGTKHELISLCVNDPRDLELPAETGEIMVEDVASGDNLLINTKIIKEDYEKTTSEHKALLEKQFKELFIDYMFITTDQPFTKVVYTFFKKRAMQAVGG